MVVMRATSVCDSKRFKAYRFCEVRTPFAMMVLVFSSVSQQILAVKMRGYLRVVGHLAYGNQANSCLWDVKHTLEDNVGHLFNLQFDISNA